LLLTRTARGERLALLFRKSPGDVASVSLNGDRAYNGIASIDESDVSSFVAGALKDVAGKIAGGKSVSRTQVREMMSLLNGDEIYWVSDIVSRIDESSDSGWIDTYSANADRIRTSLHGKIRAVEGRVPKTRFSKLPKSRLSEFKQELGDSMSILGGVYSDVAGKCDGMSFSEDDFHSGVCNSLFAEAQANGGLLGKADRLMRDDNLSHVAEAHDKLADRARTMVLMSEYLASKSSNKE